MIVAWDFDGVLNAGTRDGRFLWTGGLEAAWGVPPRALADLFADWDPVMTGREDIAARVTRWGRIADVEGFLRWWFAADTFPDAEMLALMEGLRDRGIRQIIATNNERRRAAYIEGPMGYGTLVERVFASGRMGLRKPDPAFFDAVTRALDVGPDRMVLIDDLARNVDAARDRGWEAFHLTPSARRTLPGYLDTMARRMGAL